VLADLLNGAKAFGVYQYDTKLSVNTKTTDGVVRTCAFCLSFRRAHGGSVAASAGSCLAGGRT
jgi:hypothetical protein